MAAKLSPYKSFKENLEDAHNLVDYAKAFTNRRIRRMRQELRYRIGDALKMSAGKRDILDCLESEDLFVVFKPEGNLGRSRFDDLRPLLRQALVAGCAALETYVADKTMESVGVILREGKLPRQMRLISLTVGHWAEIEDRYERRGWGIRAIIDEYIRETSSTAPNRIGSVLSTIGVKDWSKRVDKARGVDRTTTVEQLKAITLRRNVIAHSADRRGRGRAPIDVDYVKEQLGIIEGVVDALEKVITRHTGQPQ